MCATHPCKRFCKQRDKKNRERESVCEYVRAPGGCADCRCTVQWHCKCSHTQCRHRRSARSPVWTTWGDPPLRVCIDIYRQTYICVCIHTHTHCTYCLRMQTHVHVRTVHKHPACISYVYIHTHPARCSYVYKDTHTYARNRRTFGAHLCRTPSRGWSTWGARRRQ